MRNCHSCWLSFDVAFTPFCSNERRRVKCKQKNAWVTCRYLMMWTFFCYKRMWMTHRQTFDTDKDHFFSHLLTKECLKCTDNQAPVCHFTTFNKRCNILLLKGVKCHICNKRSLSVSSWCSITALLLRGVKS